MIKLSLPYCVLILLSIFLISCSNHTNQSNKLRPLNNTKTASQILGNSDYLAISYGGYREITRETEPTISQLKDDMKILSAMGIKVVRTYNTKQKQAANLLQAISEMSAENSDFEMYVMLGAWIDCKNAWTGITPNHDEENEEANNAEINRAVELANKYPDIVKIIAVGNEAMVTWATNYFVKPKVILKWVNHLQNLKKESKLDTSLWITCSDNFASWGGGDSLYHCKDLENLIKAVDYVSLHTYPMHDTHYNPVFWGILDSEKNLSKTKALELIMDRAVLYAQKQYNSAAQYIHSIDSSKQVHIGETGWASSSIGLYGKMGSKACDEYKAGLYYHKMREWTTKAGISCFYFEAFDEQWKDSQNPGGSENHFGLFKINGEAKYVVWTLVDKGVFKGLGRNGKTVQKTYNGNLNALLEDTELPPAKQLN